MRAFLEKNEKEWMDDFVYASVYPLKELGFEVIGFNGNERTSLHVYELNIKNDILIGSVDRCEYFFNECGVEIPKYIGYPDQLKKYLGRDIVLTNIETLKNTTQQYPYFVKPADRVKLFTGDIIRKPENLNLLCDFAKIVDDKNINVYKSECIDILSEYRCFVHKGVLKGIQWYIGDFKLFPDVKVIESMIKDYTDANVSYTLDVGIIKDNNGNHKTILIEVNDMWAIGSYGFNGKDYVRMTIDRFQEISKTKKC